MSGNATITLTAPAYWRLEWLCHRTGNEVSAMGLLRPGASGLVIEDFILVRQEVGPASVSLDMSWWADRQIELYDRQGLEPWRLSCWAHTHPAGINRPSATDEETMEKSFGGWDFIVMLILTKAGRLYARIDFDHDFGTGVRQRISLPCVVEIDWGTPGREAVTPETIGRWEEEFRQCVTESATDWFFDAGETDAVGLAAKPRRASWPAPPADSKFGPGRWASREEVEEYEQACRDLGFNPGDRANREDYWGDQPPLGY